MLSTTPTQPLDIGKLKELCEAAGSCRMIADTHHARWNGGREHGFLRAEGELVPVASFVLGVEGMPQDIGRARLALAAEAMNAAQSLILMAERVDRLEAALRPFAERRTIAELLADPEPPAWANATPERRIEMMGERKRENDAAIINARELLGMNAARNTLSPTTTEDQHG